MRSILIAAVALSAFAQEQTGSVQGAVTDSVTHLPVKKARIALYPQRVQPPRRPTVGPNGRFEPPPMPTTSTDAGGNFAISDLAPGTYGVHVEHPSYPPSRSTRPNTTTVEVVGGGEPAHISLELTPGATITGRIVDEDGDPLPDCYVQALPPPSRGPGRYIGAMGAEPSNDDGLYRICGIQPGKVHVLAHCGRPVFQPRPLLPVDAPAPPSSFGYPRLYYPGVPNVSGAQIVELTPGAVREGIDFRMTPVRVYTVKGTIAVLPGATEPDRRGAYLQLIKRDASEPMSRMTGSGGPIDWSKGTFEIRNVPAGSYTLLGSGLGVEADVDVIDKSVELALQVRPPLDIKGSIVVEGETRTPLTGLQFYFFPENGMGGAGPGNFQPRQDGSFVATGVNPGRYRVRIAQQEVFVKSIAAGGQDLVDNVVDLRNGAVDIRIVLSANTATIAGVAPPNRMIQVFKDDAGEIMFGMHGVMSDQQGAFELGQLAPGKYRVMLDGAEDDAQQMSLAEGEIANIELKAPVAR